MPVARGMKRREQGQGLIRNFMKTKENKKFLLKDKLIFLLKICKESY